VSPALFALLPCIPLLTLQSSELVDSLPDFSSAGYRRGKSAPRLEPAHDITAFGAIPGDGQDDSAAIQAAIDAARDATGGGEAHSVVGLGPGRWTLAKPVSIRSDGIVLKGAGSGKTILECPNSLTDVRGANKNWSWSGGFIQASPGGSTSPVGLITRRAEAGSVRLEVQWKEGIGPVAAGEWLKLSWFNDKGADTLLDHLYGGVVPQSEMGKELRASTTARVSEWVCVLGADAQSIRIERPIRIDVRPEWRPTLERKPHLREVGIEGFAMEFPLTEYPGHLKEKGYNGLALSSLVDGWVRDVRITNADSGIFVGSSCQVTVSDILVQGRRMHHVIAASWSNDCLFTRWRFEAPHRHGTTISWAAHGNVFSEGHAVDLAMDAHRAAAFMNLHTAIVIEYGEKPMQPLRSGGAFPRGPHAARGNVYWNVEHRFASRGGDFRVTGLEEWPLGVFCGWWGNRRILIDPPEGSGVRAPSLRKHPRFRDLHLYQVKQAGRKPKTGR